jgi:hypothetical protein
MKLKYLITFVLIYGLAIFVAGCGDDTVTEDPTETGSTSTTELVEDQPDKDLSIQEYNLQKRKSMTKTRFPGDTIDLMEAVLRTYPKRQLCYRRGYTKLGWNSTCGSDLPSGVSG